MSQLFHYLATGIKDGKEFVKTLYLGFDGAAGQAAYEAEIENPNHVFSRIKRIVNFDGAPLPVVSAKMTGTSPTFPKSKPLEIKAKLAGPPDSIAKAEADELEIRNRIAKEQHEKRFGQVVMTSEEPSKDARIESDPNRLRDDGPTIEEWVASGYKPEHYPPSGYAVKHSPGLDSFRESQKASGTQTQAESGSAPVSASVDPGDQPAKAEPASAPATGKPKSKK